MLVTLLLSSFFTFTSVTDTTFRTSVEIKALASDVGATPFWLRSNQYGQAPMTNATGVAIVSHQKTYRSSSLYDWKYQVEATAWGGKENDFMLTQAYVSARRGKWELWAGRRKEVYGLGDTTMTSGFYAWSGNAIPMPKIQLGTRDYLNIFGKWIGVHMTYSHGWLDNQGAIINSFLHQKTLYGRLGKPTSTINLYGGLNHNAIWGGEQKVKTGGQYDYYPSGLNTYFYVITVHKNRNLVAIDPLSTYDDMAGYYGNHYGSFDLGAKVQGSWGEILFYKQTAYETGRAFSFTTFDDGITGISYKSKKRGIIEGIGLEYLYTANQGTYVAWLGKLLKKKDPHLGEIEGYFNNGGRGGGVNYLGKGIGTPLVIIDSESVNGGGLQYTYNANKAIYMSVRGTLPSDISWMLRVSQTQHGRIGSDMTLSQFSGALTLQKNVTEKCIFTTGIGYDQGERVTNTIGIQLGAKYQIQ